MSVVSFPGVNYNDVPAMLRTLADQIESGEYGVTRGLAYAFVTDDEDVYTNCFGRISPLETCGLLSIAKNMVMETMGDIE